MVEEPVSRPRGPGKKQRFEVNGWLVLDKPVGMTSTQAVSRIKHLFKAKKVGHAGTLDPLASGILPIALGEATKTVPFVQDGRKSYRFRVRWGTQTDSDDSEGQAVATSALRPSRESIVAALPSFMGTLMQRPPSYSAIKVAGERAYDRARDGEVFELDARSVTIHALDLLDVTPDEAVFEAECGKGTYVRAIARDLGAVLGCLGHVNALRRTRVGAFDEAQAVGLPEGDGEPPPLLGVEAGLQEVAEIPIHRNDAVRLRRGQPLILRGRDAPSEGMAYASCGGVVVAFGPIETGALQPYRVFNLPF
ncbi:MAG TPA: tRNA pseudouridine(55) synthase TruB [Lichenihabitans sp.]|nr:tRNA pseudouridine(55) synthase TruB [Lichenihabitans sp.]